MQTQIVAIGNSFGLRLPKPVLEALQLEKASQLSIQVRKDSIVLRPLPKPSTETPRKGWFEGVDSGSACDAGIEADWAELDVSSLNDPALQNEWQW